MSLVSEALKKAQREAARREGRDKGLPEPLVAGAQPWRARRGSRVPIAATLAAGVLALAAGLFYFASDSGTEKPRDEIRPQKEAATAIATESDTAVATTAAVDPSPPAASSGPAEKPPLGPAVAPPGERPAPVAVPAAEPPPSAPAVAPARIESPPAAAARETTFVRSARLPSGAEIRLGGIAWSETAPLAYLNGKLLGVGESAGGARIERIERDRVVFAAPEGRLVITLR